MRGPGKHMGSRVTWKLRFRVSDGAFHESIVSSKLSYAWGFEGVGSGVSWEMDSCGVGRRLALDDHESLVLSAWARTGMYTLTWLSDHLEVLVDEEADQAHIRMKGGKQTATVKKCPASRQTKEVVLTVLGSSEVWSLSSYRPIDLLSLKGILVATEIQHKGSATSTYRLEQVEHFEDPSQESNMYQMPLSPLIPLDTTFDLESTYPGTPVWTAGQTKHLLVKPKVRFNKGLIDNGYWLLDTGASGFVISSSRLQDLGKDKDKFGNLTASGISGKASASLVHAESFSLGPLTMKDPLMMVMDLNGLVKGMTVDGIIGYDFFRRCIVEFQPHAKAGRSKTAARSLATSQPFSTLTIISPEALDGSLTQKWRWIDLIVISCLPHIHLSFEDASGRGHTLLFLLDTGASGAGLFIHSRAVESQQINLKFLANKDQGSTSHVMKGVGGQGGVSVDLVEIPQVFLGPSQLSVDKVLCVVTKGIGGLNGIDLSLYSSGIIGIDLLQGLPYCLDLPRNRLGFFI